MTPECAGKAFYQGQQCSSLCIRWKVPVRIRIAPKTPKAGSSLVSRVTVGRLVEVAVGVVADTIVDVEKTVETGILDPETNCETVETGSRVVRFCDQTGPINQDKSTKMSARNDRIVIRCGRRLSYPTRTSPRSEC